MCRKFAVLLVFILLLSGCATRINSDKVFTESESYPYHYHYQTPQFSIKGYKTPEARSKNQKKDVSVAVAISGGGHRAGNFGLGVLKELEKINVLKEIDYLSTVSGGGLAAGAYISTLYDHMNGEENKGEYSLATILDDKDSGLKRNMERGYHNILARALVNIKSIGPNDRGDYLEKEFDDRILGYLPTRGSLTLGEVFISTESRLEPTLPMWITNATIYENGSIFPFHPMGLKEYEIVKCTHRLSPFPVKDNYYGVPLSIGLKASASFPNVVPATTLKSESDPKNPYLHLFDGGLSDNLGIYSALQMLTSNENTKKVLIIIDAYNGQPEPFSSTQGSPTILQISLKTTSISLEAWRIRHKLLVEQLISSKAFNGKTVEVIYLSFDDLKPPLKDKVNKIGTYFNISKTQRDILFEAAHKVVNEKKDKILCSIFGTHCVD